MSLFNVLIFFKKTITVLGIIVLLLLFFQVFSFFQKSEYCNCVVVEYESNFTGKWLKHSNSTSFEVRKTEECIALDVTIDNGTGAKEGRVRWAECLSGPDCNEAGNF
ncbi:MAG: hypothetical protein CO186_11095 [Zetaproteobacteria bacterium CG_4_9_14_3_um_filter_49_83]|nr:MAG: hypothetical protein AUJ56_08850 [Zetaproteobacteria bacterium CG1_02_49_23]PIQ32120.1 MAG: hypothetical protein COW62_08290 [Zetaproteobacteria bacterium CG17_big_fil_post_rev_8_21_14_2_50_50_13]PIV30093.1 MAG: hypothetical protein COS35_08575 [Zetaproteobacteria bacterium CG02_land_8_20_14_3_00_50_9]PIY54768.1 MAG: hypothetical protein COZ00_13070 [Zetaproteobacteria bacterium CG_4_10_14_0_8_um_filter_49_80]PJA34331.1 MAG: hypothetical protein CO186_11095 [Zetaproteobacteria bacterium